jgi:hypothetical protein
LGPGLVTLDRRPASQVSNELRLRYNTGAAGNPFELGLMSDAAESRVTDWIQQQQRREEEVVVETDPQILFQNLQVSEKVISVSAENCSHEYNFEHNFDLKY